VWITTRAQVAFLSVEIVAETDGVDYKMAAMELASAKTLTPIATIIHVFLMNQEQVPAQLQD